MDRIWGVGMCGILKKREVKDSYKILNLDDWENELKWENGKEHRSKGNENGEAFVVIVNIQTA